MPANPVSQIDTSASPPSIGRDILRAFQRGDLTRQQYTVANAIETAKNADAWYRPRITPPLGSSLKEYCESRIRDHRGYDPSISKRLGDWLVAARKALEENTVDLEHLVWCQAQLRELKVGDLSTRLTQAMDAHAKVPSNAKEFDLAARAQAIDWKVRQDLDRKKRT